MMARSRKELLATRVMKPDEFLRTTGAYGPNGYIHPREKLSPIAVVLLPGELLNDYERCFDLWLETKHVTLNMLKGDPEEERRLRQCFAYKRANEMNISSLDVPNRKRARLSSDEGGSSEFLRNLAEKMTRQMSEMENRLRRQMVEVQEELGKLRKEEGSCGNESETNDQTHNSQETSENANANSQLDFTNGTRVVEVRIKTESGDFRERNGRILHEATEVLNKATQLDLDPRQKGLIHAYTHSTEQIVRSETEVQQHWNAIKELTNSINDDMARRDATLASMVMLAKEDWTVTMAESLKQAAQEDLAGASHVELAEMFHKLEQKNSDVAALQVMLRNRRSWLNVDDTGRDALFEELRDISNNLADELEVISELSDQCRTMSVKLFELEKAAQSFPTDCKFAAN